MEDREALEEWFREVCRVRRWTLHQWALAAGIPPQTLYRFRSGDTQSISPKNLYKLTDAAGIDPHLPSA